MAKIIAQQLFKGANTFINAKRLLEGVGLDAVDMDPTHGDMRGIRAADVVHTLTGLGSQQISLYRFGRDVASDSNYWFTSSRDTDYMRSLLSKDTTERTYYSDGIRPKWTDNTLIGGSPPYPGAFYYLGVPEPTSTMSTTVTVVGTGPDEERVYLDTHVRVINGRTEESGPGPTINRTIKTGSTVRLSSFSGAPGSSYGVSKRRIYCSTDGGPFLRVAEIPITDTTYDDTGTRGLVLQTGGDDNKPTWLVPPDDLIGLRALWNTMAFGFVGNAYRICEPGFPHAWPLEYEAVLPDTIIGAATWGTNLLLCTTGVPYVAGGTSPDALTRFQPVQFEQACVSKRSVVGVQHGVCWASPSGLCYYGQRGMLNLTENLLDLEDWQALHPETIIGANWGRWYIGFYFDGTNRRGFMIDTLEPSGLIWLTQGAFGVFYDTVADRLYLLDSAFRIRKWDTGDRLTAQFTTPNVRSPIATNPGAASVVASQYPVTLTLFADDVERHTATVTSELPFNLPGGYHARTFRLTASGVGPVEALILADGMDDIP